jgi:hypothetical protein
MGRSRKQERDELLIHFVRTRISDKAFQRLNSILAKSNCRTLCQLARKILSADRIIVYHADKSLEEPVQQLIQIREELRAIGVNINQITHQFHIADSRQQKMFHALKVSEEYGKVGDKVEVLVRMVAELGEKWLQRSFQVER